MSYPENLGTYRELMRDFVHRNLDGLTFEKAFCELWRKDSQEEFSLPVKNELLDDLFSRIFTACDVFEPDPDLRKHYEYSEEELRSFVRDMLEENKHLFREF